MSDIQTILQLLQRQPTLGPPAYSTVTASPDYHRPAVKAQPVALPETHFFSHTGNQVRMFPLSFLSFFVRVFSHMRHCIFIFFLRWSRASVVCYNHRSQSHQVIGDDQGEKSDSVYHLISSHCSIKLCSRPLHTVTDDDGLDLFVCPIVFFCLIFAITFEQSQGRIWARVTFPLCLSTSLTHLSFYLSNTCSFFSFVRWDILALITFFILLKRQKSCKLISIYLHIFIRFSFKYFTKNRLPSWNRTSNEYICWMN